MTHAIRNKKSSHLFFQFDALGKRWVIAAPIIASGNVAVPKELKKEPYALVHASGKQSVLTRLVEESCILFLEYAEAYCYERYGDDSLAPEVVERATTRLLTSILREQNPRRQFTGRFLCNAIRLAAGEIYRPQVRRQKREVAFSSPSDDGDDVGSLLDELPAEGDFFAALYLADFWKWADQNLTAQERQIMEQFLEGALQTEIASEFGISRDRVRRAIIDVAYRWLGRPGSSRQI